MDPEANQKQFFLKQTHVLYDTLMYKNKYHKARGNIFTFGGNNGLNLFWGDIQKKANKQQNQNVKALNIKIGIFKVKKCKGRGLDMKRFYIIIALKEKTIQILLDHVKT